MSKFPVKVLTKDNIFVRFKEKYSTDPLNKKLTGMPTGIAYGFSPLVDGSNPTTKIILNTDSSRGYSILRVKSSTSINYVDLYTDTDIELDFTSHVFGAAPTDKVYVIAIADYKIGSNSSASIITRNTPGNGIDEITICRVEKPVTNLVVYASDIPADRHTMIAHSSAYQGFMPGGSVENLETVTNSVNEVIAAREDISGNINSSLNDRLISDFSSISSRLGKPVDIIQGNKYTLLTSASNRSSLNITSSIADKTREFEPIEYIKTSGDETIGSGNSGIVTDPPNNICLVVNHKTGNFFTDDLGNVVYGRVRSIVETDSGSILSSFNNAQTLVIGSSSYSDIGIESGDILLAPDGSRYAVSSIDISDPTLMNITPSYTSAGTAVTNVLFYRLTIDFFTVVGATETAYSFDTNSVKYIQPFFIKNSLLDDNRLSSLNSLLLSSQYTIDDATESSYGYVKFGADGVTTAGLALQGNDSRLVDICKTDGSTDFTAVQSYDQTYILTADESLTHKKYVDDSGFSNFDTKISPTYLGGSTHTYVAVFAFEVKTAYVGINYIRDGVGGFWGLSEGLVSIDTIDVLGSNVIVEWTTFSGTDWNSQMMICAAG